MKSKLLSSTNGVLCVIKEHSYFNISRLWNELTIKLTKFVRHESLQNEDDLLQLYHNFITSFETK